MSGEIDTRKHIARVGVLIHLVIKNLLDRASNHDATKLEDPEVAIFERVSDRLAELHYDSKEYKECLAEMKPALDHHYAKNRHHPEHFVQGVRDMTLIDIIEMLCDWKAASERQLDGNILKSIDQNKARFGYSSELADILANTVKALGFVEG